MTFKNFIENAEELRRQLNAKREEIEYLVDVFVRWCKIMTARKYWAGRNQEQYQAAREEETQLANIFSKYPHDLRIVAQELGKNKLNFEKRH